MAKRTEDWTFAVNRPYGRIQSCGAESERYDMGVVLTPFGVVDVYAQGGETNTLSSRLDFVWQGRCYVRSIHGQRLTKRGLVTAADRFAREIVGHD